jgi:ABC-2 type transport system ATP-binding protein
MNLRTVSETAPLPVATFPAPAPAIQLENISVCYRVPTERISSFKEYLIRRLKRQIGYKQFWALKKIDLEVYPGQVLGVIGPNGAGKSTLLKVVSRVLRPTGGRVRVRGRLAPLLELGAGFDFELSGRENIFLYGAILGFTHRDIRERLERIVAFAGLAEFIDLPLRTYSTGMVSRLGFAVATDVRPDILIVDEVLSVGDAEFQKRSQARIKQFKQAGSTILLVSHNLMTMKAICEQTVWLDHGHIQAMGRTTEIIEQYQK